MMQCTIAGGQIKQKELIDHFTVETKLPGLTMEARLPVPCFDTNLHAFVMSIWTN